MFRKILLATMSLILVPLGGLLIYHLATPGNGSLQMKAMKVALRVAGKQTDPNEHVRELQAKAPTSAPVPGDFAQRYVITRTTLHGRPVITLAPKQGRSKWHVIYTHGGAFVAPISDLHWSAIDVFSRQTGATITVPLYGIAPKHNYREAYAFLRKVYEQVLASTTAKNIVLAGDSAGGNLALVQAIIYRDAGLAQPARLVLLAPWLDLSLSDPAALQVQPRDPMLDIGVLRADAKLWADGEDLKSPSISPLYADLSGLPPIDLFQGSDDVFLPDARKLARHVRQVGGEIRYFEYPGGFHAFMGVTFLPESRGVMDEVASALPR